MRLEIEARYSISQTYHLNNASWHIERDHKRNLWTLLGWVAVLEL